MALGVFLQGWEDERKDHMPVLHHEADNVIVVPQVKSSLSNLKLACFQINVIASMHVLS